MWFFSKKEKVIDEPIPESRIVKIEIKGPDDVVTGVTFQFQVLRYTGPFHDDSFDYKSIYECADLEQVKDYKKRYEYITKSTMTTTVIE